MKKMNLLSLTLMLTIISQIIFAQEFYLTERVAGVLAKVDASGTRTVVANIPLADGVILASSTKAYVSRLRNSGPSLFSVNLSNGAITAIASLNSKCQGMDFDDEGNLYLVNETLGVVHKMDTSTNTLSIVASNINYPIDVHVESDSTLLISDFTDNHIIRYNMTTNTQTVFATGFINPTDIYEEEDGNLLVAEWGNAFNGPATGALSRVNINTGVRTVIKEFNDGIHGIAKFDNDHVLVTRYNSDDVVKVRLSDGAVTPFSSGHDQPIFIVSTESIAPVCDFFTVYLKDSNGNPLGGGSLEYREGGPNGWNPATEIANGEFCIDTERTQVGLRMTVSPQVLKVAEIPTNEPYTFQMENVTVELTDDGTPVDGGVVMYSSDGWFQFGSGTTGDDGQGIVTMDMLPTVYSFRMDYDGMHKFKKEIISSNNKHVTFDIAELKTASVEGENDFQLAAYPNPFSGNTTIAFSLEEAHEVNISVYDQTGGLIEVLQDGIQTEGNHKISWDARNMNKGIYLIRMTSNGQVANNRVVKM